VSEISEQRFAEDLTRAMKARETRRVYVLRDVLTAIKNAKVEKRGAALADADIVQIVRREIRKREEAEGFAAQAGRQELVEQNRSERALLEAYVPAPLAADELERAIRDIASTPEGKNLGGVMSALRTRFAGRFDGRQASEVARRVLAESATA
jgi:uncharacterized protein YqeY